MTKKTREGKIRHKSYIDSIWYYVEYDDSKELLQIGDGIEKLLMTSSNYNIIYSFKNGKTIIDTKEKNELLDEVIKDINSSKKW